MSYGSSPAPGKSKGGGLIFLIVVGIGLFLLFSNRGGTGNPQNPASPIEQDSSLENAEGTSRGRVSPDNGMSSGGDFEPREMPSTGSTSKSGDWDMQDATKGSTVVKPTAKPAAKSNDNDWSIDDASGKTTNDQFKFSDPKNKSVAKPADPPKGDWSIDDAGTSSPKKTEKGDWAIEDGSKEKKK